MKNATFNWIVGFAKELAKTNKEIYCIVGFPETKLPLNAWAVWKFKNAVESKKNIVRIIV